MATQLRARAQQHPDRSASTSVRLRDVRKAHRSRRGEVLALDGLTLTVGSTEVVAVVGRSGCGKSTLLELVCGLLAPDGGELDAEPAALMPQRDLLLPWCSALDNAALSLRVVPRRAGGLPRARARARAAPMLEQFGLAEFASARPAELSGGMRQRIAFLRTLLAGRPVLCLDEPFGALDAITRQEMQDWLAGALAREPRAVLLVTHDVEEALLLADRVAVLSPRPGRVVAELAVPLPRPRRRTDPGLLRLRAQAMEALR
jgi:NitT/TauT family transport system ATP-binding protein